MDDYAILGGGFSGLYILSNIPSKYRATLYEKTSRLGGRIYTYDYIDYGAARFKPDDIYIADRLNIPTVYIKDYPSNNFTFINGKVKYFGDIQDILKYMSKINIDVVDNKLSFKDVVNDYWYDKIWRITGYDMFRNLNINANVLLKELISTSDYHYYPVNGMYNVIDKLVELAKCHKIYTNCTDIKTPVRNIIIAYPPKDDRIWYSWSAIKICIKFNKNWFTDLGLEYGKFTSDRMIRQLFYLPPSSIIIYCDDITAKKWRDMLPSDESEWIKVNNKQPYVNIINRELSKMFGIDDFSIRMISWKYWKCGCNMWRRGVDMINFPNMYISDCYSYECGWLSSILKRVNI